MMSNYDVGVPIDNCRFSVLHVIYVDICNLSIELINGHQFRIICVSLLYPKVITNKKIKISK